MDSPEPKTPSDQPLSGRRVLAAINGLDLFGQERENIAVFQTLRDLGAEVLVGINSKEHGGQVGGRLRALDFQVFELPFGNQWSWLWLRRYPLSIFKKGMQVIRCSRIMRKAIREFDPTHIHIGSPLVYSFVAPTLRSTRIPLIYRIGDLPPTDSWFNLPIWRSAMRRADLIVPVSRFIQDRVAQTAGKKAAQKSRLIYPSILQADHSTSSQRGKPQFRIGYVGQITKQKGIQELLDAFSQVLKTHPQLMLDVCGSGSELEASKHRIKALGLDDRVVFHGFLDDPDIVMRNCLFQIVPSIWQEPLGLVVLEAKSNGIPAVVFPNGGLPEMIRHKVDGYRCPEPTTAALAEAILFMLSPDANLPRMGISARQDFHARFGSENFHRAWAKVYSGGHATLPSAPRQKLEDLPPPRERTGISGPLYTAITLTKGMAADSGNRLKGIRVIAAINGLELFGHERANIEVIRTLWSMGAEVLVGINAKERGGQVGDLIRELGFDTFELPFGNQWSMKWIRKYPLSLFEKAGQVIRCSRRLKKAIHAFKPTHIHLGSPLVYSFLAPALATDSTPLIYRIGDLPPLDSWFNLPIWRRAMRRADVVVPISRFIKEAVARATRESVAAKCRLIYPTIWKPEDGFAPARQPQFRIAFVGQIAKHKGILEMLEAFFHV